MSDDPKVSIGLPVFNGEAFLSSAINSILAQTFQDFEVIICDNASTDRTMEISKEFEARDSRIRYVRNDQNLGAAENFNRTFVLAKGIYFKWCAHDDVCAPGYLEKCVVELDADDSIILCHSRIHIIDDQGAFVSEFEPDLAGIESDRPSDRFKSLIRLDHFCYDIFGLMRADVLRETPLIASYVASDHCLLVELGLRGRFRRVPEPLFCARDHKDRSIQAMNLRDRGEWFHPDLKGKIATPFLKRLVEFFRSLWRVRPPLRETIRCHWALLVWTMHSRACLVSDLRHAAGRILRPHRVAAPESG